MLKNVVDRVLDRVGSLKTGLALRRISDLDEFEAYVERVRPSRFLRCREASPQARQRFLNVVSALGIELAGSRFLDLGPAYGDGLDVCAESGGVVEYVEPDPYFHVFNRLKGYPGHRFDPWTGLERLAPMTYDIIWTKGSLVADRFNVDGPTRFLTRNPASLSMVLADIDRVAAKGCHIILCPYWRHEAGRRTVGNVLASSFAREMKQAGFGILTGIGSPDENLMHPVTFHKRARVLARQDEPRRDGKVHQFRRTGI